MDILDDLNLIDFSDDFDMDLDFDLDDILSEFSTPGLFSAPKKPESAVVAPVEEVLPMPEPEPELPPAEILPADMGEETTEEYILTDDPTITFAAITEEDLPAPEPAVVEEELPAPEPVVAEEELPVPEPAVAEETVVFSAMEELPEEEPVTESDVPAFTAEESHEEEDEDVRVYVHSEEDAPAVDLDMLETVPFGAVADPAPPERTPAAPAQPAAKPGFFAKLAALFSRKKAPTPAVSAAEALPSAAEDILPAFTADITEEDSAEDILLFMSEPAEEDTLEVTEEPEAEEAAEEVICEEIPEAEEALEEVSFEEVPVEELSAEEPAEEVPMEEDTPASSEAAEEALPEDEPAEAVAEDKATEAMAENELVTEAEEEVPVAEIAEAVTPASSVEDDDEIISIDDLLFEFSDIDDDFGIKVYDPAADTSPMDEDVRVYVAADTDRAASDLDMLETVPFTAVADLDVSAAPAPAAKPGLLTIIAGVFAGLFAKKQKNAPRQPDAQTYTPAASNDPFDGMEELFSIRDMVLDEEDVDPELMLELEMAAEREAELEANAAAADAHDQLVHTPAPEFVVPDAVLEAQQEQEAAIRAAEEAARLAEEEEEAPLTAEEEAKLFAWLDTLAAPDSVPATDSDEDNSSATSLSELSHEPEYAPQPEYTPAYGLDAEDAPVALMPTLTIDEEEEEPVVDETEPVSPEALQESMELAEELRHADESPAEAAARRAKEDAELRYVPDDPPAKVIGSRIAGRFGAAFAAFTQADADPGEDEEALGPEVPPSKAYRYFDKYVTGYRFRLRIAVILSILIGWISLGLPVFGSLNNTAVAAAACLMIQLSVMLAGADILATGVRGLLRRKPGLQSMLLLSSLASVLDAVVIILTKGAGGYLPFCGVSAISMCFAIYGSLLYCRGQRFTFRSLEQAAQPMTIGVDYGIVDEETTTAYRAPGHPDQFIHRSEEEDLSETVYGIMGPALTVAIPVLALLAAAVSKSFGDFFHIMAAMFAAAGSFGAVVAFPLPYFLVQRDLYAAKAAIAGWAGTKELGRVATMIVTDRDLFPDETVSIDSVRIVDSVPPELTLSYFCSLILKSDSCLAPAFTQLAENNECEILPVENFRCHEAGGLSGVIGPDEVLVASHSYMKLQGFRIPARKKDSENALFLAVNGHVIAYIMINYRPLKSVREGLASAISGNVEMVFAARDFNVTPLLISKKFKSPTDTLRFPSYEQRFEITEHGGSDTATCAAVVSRKSFYSYAMVVKKARNLYSSVSWATILSALSSLLGVVLMFVMALTGTGAAVTVGRLLMFMLLFVVPTLALCVSITK